jgi:hypothetical protein
LAAGHPGSSRRTVGRLSALAREEHGLFVLAAMTVAIRVADDSFLQPQPGT